MFNLLKKPMSKLKNIFIGQKKIADVIEIITNEFSEEYYCRQYPEIMKKNIKPLNHFIKYGWKEGKNPNSEFSTIFYLKCNPDVVLANINPFYHYLKWGSAENRLPKENSLTYIPDTYDSSQTSSIQDKSELDGNIIESQPTKKRTNVMQVDSQLSYVNKAVKDDFDDEFYLLRYPDISSLNISPLDHYVNYGWKEGRDPNAQFSTQYYLKYNVDVKDLGMNPFYHYVIAGRSEGRLSKIPGGFRTEVLSNLKSIDERVSSWIVQEEFSVITKPAILKMISERLNEKIDGIVISFSHDDYTSVVGGVQMCILVEQKSFEEKNKLYINLNPAQPLPILSKTEDPDKQVLNLICNGELLGQCLFKDLFFSLTELKKESLNLSWQLIIHSLMGHKVENVVEIGVGFGIDSPIFWIHDEFTICPSYALLRNDITYCGAPDCHSAACSICVYGEVRIEHNKNIQKLFNALKFTVVAPSEFTKKLWCEKSNLKAQRVIVKKHCEFISEKNRVFVDMKNSTNNKPIKVAFLGAPAVHKGWHVFCELVKTVKNSDRFEFFHFGSTDSPWPNVKFREVNLNSDKRDEMTEFLRRDSIDLVVLWSLCPETFSFTAYEALAAGVILVTYKDSGNIPEVIKSHNNGLIFSSETELIKAFDGTRISDFVEEWKLGEIPVGTLKFGCMSSDIY